MLEKLLGSKKQADKCEPITTDSQMEYVAQKHKYFIIITTVLSAILLAMLLITYMLNDYVIVEGQISHVYGKPIGQPKRVNKVYFDYKYIFEGNEYVGQTYKYNPLFHKVGDKEKILVSSKNPLNIQTFSPLKRFALYYSLFALYLIERHLVYRHRKENYLEYKNELNEIKKAEELSKRTYQLGEISIVLPEKIKSVVKLKYGVAILTELTENSDCPRNIYNYLDDGRLLWQINPNYDIFGIKELQEHIDFKYQFTSLNLRNDFLYTSACGVNFVIDIGTGKCMSYNFIKFNETQNYFNDNNKSNPYYNYKNINIHQNQSIDEYLIEDYSNKLIKENKENLSYKFTNMPFWLQILIHFIALFILSFCFR